jgi:hypothetical protein
MRTLRRFAPFALLLVAAAARAALPDTDADSVSAPPRVAGPATRQPAAARSGAPRKPRSTRPCHGGRRGGRVHAPRTPDGEPNAQARPARASEKAGA